MNTVPFIHYYLIPVSYRQYHSCKTSLLNLTSSILWGMERQEISSLVVMDLSAAFDTVDQSILTDVLQCKFGIQNKTLDCFTSYLGPRWCQVDVRGSKLAVRQIKYRVAEGSCGIRMMFSVYSSTLQEVVPLTST